MSESLVGKTIKGRYEIIKQLGAGGFGVTYLAYDRDLPGSPKRVVKHLAPKQLPSDNLYLAERLFKQEAELLYKLGEQHEQIPSLYAYPQEEDQFYLVQEYIEGYDLTQEIPYGKKLSEANTLILLEEILSVLSFVHKNGVIHRDIKPQNIMRRQSDGKLFLIDFGAVKEISILRSNAQGQSTVTIGIGSPGYMPNEQANGRPKLSSDIYAVGMIGVQCLTGMLPIQLKENQYTGEIVWHHYVQVKDSTKSFIDKMIRDHFSERYPSAADALDELKYLVSASENNIKSKGYNFGKSGSNILKDTSLSHFNPVDINGESISNIPTLVIPNSLDKEIDHNNIKDSSRNFTNNFISVFPILRFTGGIGVLFLISSITFIFSSEIEFVCKVFDNCSPEIRARLYLESKISEVDNLRNTISNNDLSVLTGTLQKIDDLRNEFKTKENLNPDFFAVNSSEFYQNLDTLESDISNTIFTINKQRDEKEKYLSNYKELVALLEQARVNKARAISNLSEDTIDSQFQLWQEALNSIDKMLEEENSFELDEITKLKLQTEEDIKGFADQILEKGICVIEVDYSANIRDVPRQHFFKDLGSIPKGWYTVRSSSEDPTFKGLYYMINVKDKRGGGWLPVKITDQAKFGPCPLD